MMSSYREAIVGSKSSVNPWPIFAYFFNSLFILSVFCAICLWILRWATFEVLSKLFDIFVWFLCIDKWCLSLFSLFKLTTGWAHLLKGALNIEIRGNIISKVGRSTPLFTVFVINSKWIYNYENNTSGYCWEYIICQIQSPPGVKTTREDSIFKSCRRITATDSLE